MTLNLWKQYAPSAAQPWNTRRVIHLHRRAAFAASWEEIQRDLREGPDRSISRLIDGKQTANIDDFESVTKRIGDAATRSERADRLKAWWLLRMLGTSDPLGERLTLMWHNHFATSQHKVRNLALMKRQNDLFREHARANYADLLPLAVKSPATLIWLDAQANHKDHPNENLARELMELFSIGVGNYSESDVKEAARALTGWTVKNDEFQFDETAHDAGEKTIFGKQGRWTGDDLLRLLLDHPATSRRLAFRITELFMGERVISELAIDELAAGLRATGLSIAWAVETVLRSELFFDDANIGNRPLAPTEFIVGVVRALEQFSPPPSTILLAEWAVVMGQDLFHPPSVFGWPGGRAWLTTRTLIARSNFVQRFLYGDEDGTARAFNIQQFASHVSGQDRQQIQATLGLMLTGVAPSAADQSSPQTTTPTDAEIREILSRILTSSDAQLG